MEAPYYHMIPKDVEGNLRMRRHIYGKLQWFPKYQKDLWAMCARDPLAWANLFIWAHNPKDDNKKTIQPFITWKIQDEAIATVIDAMGEEDVCIKKSRDMGGSWCCLIAFLHRWLFHPSQSLLLISHKADYVDQKGSDKALMTKLDHMIAHLPMFMQPQMHRAEMILANLTNNSRFTGEASTGDVGRGGKCTAALWDEIEAWEVADGYRALSALSENTNCRVLNSTVNSKAGVFYLKCESARKTGGKLVEMHWRDNPRKAAGMYIFRNEKLEILDKDYKFPYDYPFIKDGKLRSVYYDKFCRQNPVPLIISTQLDMDWGSGSQYFEQDLIRELINKSARPPDFVGSLSYNDQGDPVGFVPSENGPLKLWANVQNGQLADVYGESFAAGADPSYGTGASDSVLTIANRRTGMVAAELAANNLQPTVFADYTVALCRAFNDAYLCWEAPGPGRTFGPRVIDRSYTNIYYHRSDKKAFPTPGDVPGWWSNDDLKRQLLTTYKLMLMQGEFINCSRASLMELAEFAWMDGKLVHQKSLATEKNDSSGSGQGHGDRCISAALTALAMKDRPFQGYEEMPGKKDQVGTIAQMLLQQRKIEEPEGCCEF